MGRKLTGHDRLSIGVQEFNGEMTETFGRLQSIPNDNFFDLLRPSQVELPPRIIDRRRVSHRPLGKGAIGIAIDGQLGRTAKGGRMLAGGPLGSDVGRASEHLHLCQRKDLLTAKVRDSNKLSGCRLFGHWNQLSLDSRDYKVPRDA